MRTSIDIDEVLMQKARAASGQATKRGVVEEALRLLVRLKSEEDILALRGRIDWKGNLAASRKRRFAA